MASTGRRELHAQGMGSGSRQAQESRQSHAHRKSPAASRELVIAMNAPNLFKMPARSIDLEILMNEFKAHLDVARAFREDGLVALRREMWFDSNRFESSANYARAHNAIQSARRTKR